MKLATAALAVSVSLFGCAMDNEGEGGGYLEGLRPAKPSLDEFQRNTALNPAIEYVVKYGMTIPDKGGVIVTPDGGEVSAEEIRVPFPIEGLCVACDVLALRDVRRPDELNLLDEYGQFFCRMWVEPTTGRLLSTDCQ